MSLETPLLKERRLRLQETEVLRMLDEVIEEWSTWKSLPLWMINELPHAVSFASHVIYTSAMEILRDPRFLNWDRSSDSTTAPGRNVHRLEAYGEPKNLHEMMAYATSRASNIWCARMAPFAYAVGLDLLQKLEESKDWARMTPYHHEQIRKSFLFTFYDQNIEVFDSYNCASSDLKSGMAFLLEEYKKGSAVDHGSPLLDMRLPSGTLYLIGRQQSWRVSFSYNEAPFGPYQVVVGNGAGT